MEIQTAFAEIGIHSSDGEGEASPMRRIRGAAIGKVMASGKVGAKTRLRFKEAMSKALAKEMEIQTAFAEIGIHSNDGEGEAGPWRRIHEAAIGKVVDSGKVGAKTSHRLKGAKSKALTKEMEIQTAVAEIGIHSNDGEGEASPWRRIHEAAIGKVVSSGKVGAKTPVRLKGAKSKALTTKNPSRRGGNQTQIPIRDGVEEQENRRPPPTTNAAAAEVEKLKEENALIVYRRRWERSWAPTFGSFEDETSIGPMRFTSGPIPANAFPEQTLQIFSIRVRAPTDGLKWPLRVYGYVATRDTADHNRNYLFRRKRDNCQTLTQKDPFLVLTGPSRAIVNLDPITFEVELKVKGKCKSEDKMLAFNVFYYDDGFHCERRISICNPHHRCTLEYAVALRQRSVEATISIKVVDGSWPDNHRGEVVCLTSGVKGKIVLLNSGEGELPISSDGVIELSRRVVSVELGEKLLVAVDASLSGFLARATAIFKPENSGMSVDMIDLGSCKMQVTVAWSLLVII